MVQLSGHAGGGFPGPMDMIVMWWRPRNSLNFDVAGWKSCLARRIRKRRLEGELPTWRWSFPFVYVVFNGKRLSTGLRPRYKRTKARGWCPILLFFGITRYWCSVALFTIDTMKYSKLAFVQTRRRLLVVAFSNPLFAICVPKGPLRS